MAELAQAIAVRWSPAGDHGQDPPVIQLVAVGVGVATLVVEPDSGLAASPARAAARSGMLLTRARA